MNQQHYPTVSDEAIQSEDAVVEMPLTEDEIVVDIIPDSEEAAPKKKRFGKLLGLYSLILLMIIIGTLLGLHAFLVDYEAATPNAALEQYTEWLHEKNYEAIYESAKFEETSLNDKDAFLEYLERLYAGDPADISFRERSATVEGQKQFSVYFDDKRVSILDLIPLEEGWQVVPQLVYQEDYLIYASPEVRLTVNGEDISLLGFSSKPVQESLFVGVTDTAIYPQINCYTVSGLLNPPVVEALDLNGDTCTILKNEDEPQVFRVMSSCTEEEKLAQEELAKNAAFTYAKFVARDATRNALLKLVYKESSLYESIRNFSNVWFPAHQAYEFKDEQLLNSVRYTDRDFTCEVKFRPFYTNKGKTYENDPVHYRMTFLLIEDQWTMISLTPVADNTDNDASGGSTTTATTTSTAAATTTTTA